MPDNIIDMATLTQIQTEATQIVCDAAVCSNIPLAVTHRESGVVVTQGHVSIVLLATFLLIPVTAIMWTNNKR